MMGAQRLEYAKSLNHILESSNAVETPKRQRLLQYRLM